MATARQVTDIGGLPYDAYVSDRIALAREFGATDVVRERGEEAVERVRELTGGFGAHSVLECVGHGASMQTAIPTLTQSCCPRWREIKASR